MNYSPSLEEALAIAASGDYQVIPVKRELYADFCTPIRALRILQQVSSHCYLLESMEDHQRWGRYTFLGYHPTLEVTCTDGHMRVKGGSTIRMETDHPGQCLRQILAEHKSPRLRDLIPPECLYVAESGVKGPADVAALKAIGADAVLMGEVLMRAKDKAKLLAELRGACG